MRLSHCTSASNWELPLLCSLLQDHNRFKAMQKTTSFFSSYCNQGHDLYHVGWKDLSSSSFGKGNDTSWWGSLGRSGSLPILNRKFYVCALMYVPSQISLQQFSLGRRPQTDQPDQFWCLCTGIYNVTPPQKCHININTFQNYRRSGNFRVKNN